MTAWTPSNGEIDGHGTNGDGDSTDPGPERGRSADALAVNEAQQRTDAHHVEALHQPKEAESHQDDTAEDHSGPHHAARHTTPGRRWAALSSPPAWTLFKTEGLPGETRP